MQPAATSGSGCSSSSSSCASRQATVLFTRAASRDSAARESRGAEGNRAGLLRLGSLPVSCGLLIDLWAFDPIG